MTDSLKIGDLVIPSSFSKYKEIYPPKMIIDIVEHEKEKHVFLEGEELPKKAINLMVVSRA
jgi:hypothetical protein|tara:strand:- start:44 stop:226 length:183 start_codon:yes stop_codon:yes gene_type:complete